MEEIRQTTAASASASAAGAAHAASLHIPTPNATPRTHGLCPRPPIPARRGNAEASVQCAFRVAITIEMMCRLATLLPGSARRRAGARASKHVVMESQLAIPQTRDPLSQEWRLLHGAALEEPTSTLCLATSNATVAVSPRPRHLTVLVWLVRARRRASAEPAQERRSCRVQTPVVRLPTPVTLCCRAFAVTLSSFFSP